MQASPAPKEESKNIPDTTPPEFHRAHTYQDDLTKAMNATDASVVQELLVTARERESALQLEKKQTHEKKWFRVLSLFFLCVAIASLGYGYYHYQTLTVPVERSISVGVFPETEPVLATQTDIRSVVERFVVDTTIPEEKPTLIALVSDNQTRSPLSVEQFFSFIEASPSEPFIRSIENIKLGVLNTGTEIFPFIVLSVPNPERASKEFLIAEPDMMQLFYKALRIDLATYQEEVGSSFESRYIANLPVRVFRQTSSGTEQEVKILYGYATDQIIVIATNPVVLRAVHDTIVRQ